MDYSICITVCRQGTGSQTTKHVLQSCSIYEPLREGIWPLHTPVACKLYGSLGDLRCTAAFIEKTGAHHTPLACKLYGSLRDLRCTAAFIEKTGVSIWRTRRRRRRSMPSSVCHLLHTLAAPTQSQSHSLSMSLLAHLELNNHFYFDFFFFFRTCITWSQQNLNSFNKINYAMPNSYCSSGLHRLTVTHMYACTHTNTLTVTFSVRPIYTNVVYYTQWHTYKPTYTLVHTLSLSLSLFLSLSHTHAHTHTHTHARTHMYTSAFNLNIVQNYNFS